MTVAAGFAFAALALAATGCTQTNNGTGGNADGGAGSGDDTANDPPHALGVITLGEAHSAGVSSSVTPLVSAYFMPDSSKMTKCTTAVAGCQILKAPTCGTGGVPSCGADEACTLDSSCKPVCTKACTMSCADGQECYFATPTTPSCRKIETFDAGAISFAGTTTPITLFPPYAFSSTTSGAPFLAGAQIEVQGSGATGAGFDKFDEKFTATSLLQTSPTLDKIPLQTVFGKGVIPISWAAGQDTVQITVSGPYGSATCAADDTKGEFDVPRAVVDAVSTNPATGGETGLTPSISLSVSRQRQEIHKDAKTKGTLTSATVQPVGFLQLTTSSTESYSYQGCSTGQAMCGAACVDVLSNNANCGTCGNSCGAGYCQNGGCYGVCSNTSQIQCSGGCVDPTTDSQNCGYCGNACPSGQTCSNSTCSGASTTDCTTCAQQSTSSTGACYSEYSACTSDSDCSALQTCLNGCGSTDTTCRSNCESAHTSGTNELQALDSCICSTACTTQCASSCGSAP